MRVGGELLRVSCTRGEVRTKGEEKWRNVHSTSLILCLLMQSLEVMPSLLELLAYRPVAFPGGTMPNAMHYMLLRFRLRFSILVRARSNEIGIEKRVESAYESPICTSSSTTGRGTAR
jgi:hypothetical protein